MGSEESQYRRPRWLLGVFVLFIAAAAAFMGWLGWMVLTGGEEGPIPEKYSDMIGIGLVIMLGGGFLLGILDVFFKLKHKFKGSLK